MVNDNGLSDSVLIQIGALEKDIKDLEDILSHLEHSGESGRGYDRQVANIKNQIQQKTKQIQQFKRSINMNDAMDQLAMIGITQDARSVSEIQREFDYWDKGYEYFSERYLYWKSIYESTKEAKAKVDMENYKKKRDEANKKRKEFANEMSRTALNKDDDATEHGSIETYGKEKETETMPLEKNPVQAQDAEANYRGWRVVTKPARKGFSGYVAEIIPPKQSRPFDETANHKSESEAMEWGKKLVNLYIQEGVGVNDEEPKACPTQDGVGGLFGYEQNVGRKRLKEMLEDLKRKKATLERAISSQEHYYTNPKTKQDEQELAGIEMQIQTVQHMLSKATHDEEPTNAVKDSYDMLKLCGIVNDAYTPGNRFNLLQDLLANAKAYYAQGAKSSFGSTMNHIVRVLNEIYGDM